jgi:gas vesicle protein
MNWSFTNHIFMANKNKIMSTGKLFLGILAGVTAGLLLGMSFAPHTSSETLKKLAKKEKDFANDAK